MSKQIIKKLAQKKELNFVETITYNFEKLFREEKMLQLQKSMQQNFLKSEVPIKDGMLAKDLNFAGVCSIVRGMTRTFLIRTFVNEDNDYTVLLMEIDNNNRPGNLGATRILGKTKCANLDEALFKYRTLKTLNLEKQIDLMYSKKRA